MTLRYLLDTHVLLRWLAEPTKLSREQLRVLRNGVQRNQPVGVSAISLVEIAVLFGDGSQRMRIGMAGLLDELGSNPVFRILPISTEIAAEIHGLGGALRDPADRTIVATARVHRLSLITSDQRIVESGLVSVVE